MPRLLLASALVLTASAAAAGCDGHDSLLGEFRGTDRVGAASRAVEGEAVYTVVETAAGPQVVLGLFAGDLYDNDRDEYDYVLFRLPGARPGVGAYVVDGDPGLRAVSATLARVDDAGDVLEARGVVLAGTAGTLAITSVDGYGFTGGTYAFEAEGVRVREGAGAVSGAARGQFEAYYAEPAVFRSLGLDLGL